MKLCKCNFCGSVFEDTNPQINAKEWNIDIAVPKLIDHNCPKCKTDGYLSDDVVESDIEDLLTAEDLKNEHKKGLCNCDLTEGGYGLCLYGQYENGIITLEELVA